MGLVGLGGPLGPGLTVNRGEGRERESSYTLIALLRGVPLDLRRHVEPDRLLVRFLTNINQPSSQLARLLPANQPVQSVTLSLF